MAIRRASSSSCRLPTAAERAVTRSPVGRRGRRCRGGSPAAARRRPAGPAHRHPLAVAPRQPWPSCMPIASTTSTDRRRARRGRSSWVAAVTTLRAERPSSLAAEDDAARARRLGPAAAMRASLTLGAGRIGALAVAAARPRREREWTARGPLRSAADAARARRGAVVCHRHAAPCTAAVVADCRGRRRRRAASAAVGSVPRAGRGRTQVQCR